MYYNKKTSELTSIAPWGNSFIVDEEKEIHFADWQKVDDDFLPPTVKPPIAEQLSALEAIYQPQFTALAQSLGLATLEGNQTVIDGIKADYADLKAEYQTKLEAVNNG